MHSFTYAATVLASTLTFAAATGFDASSNSNMAVYWGQGSDQKPLRYFCDEESIDIIPIGFVNVFPDQKGANGYPGTNFGNACGGGYYKSPDGKETRLLASCTQIGSDIEYCQAKGKKVLLSLGGGSPDVYIANEQSAKDMADFLWGAFGPKKHTWNGPRPFGDACVDGFDFDIESHAANITGPVDFGYATMVDRFRQLFVGHGKEYYISAAPQCMIPDSHLSDAISKSIFDFIFVQFYNTPSCSARAGLDHRYGAYGGPDTDISFDSWVDHVQTKSANKGAKIYLGLPAATGATFGSMYLSPEEAQQLVEKFQCKWPTMFGGVMLWEATFSQNNQVNEMSYGKNVKKGMESCSCASKPSSTSSMVMSSTISPTSVPTVSTSSIVSSSEHYPTNSTFSTSHPITSSSSTVESLSSSYMTTYDDVSISSTTSASPSASPSSCGVKGFDKSPAYNFLNDTTSANFENCSARCAAYSSCVSFAFGYTQCLLYTQTVASNVNENSESPFTFYDKYCGAAPFTSSTVSSSASSTVSPSETSSEVATSSAYESQLTSSDYLTSSSTMESSSVSEPYPTGPHNITSSGYANPTGSPTASEPQTTTSDSSVSSSTMQSSVSEPYPTGPKNDTSSGYANPTGSQSSNSTEHPPHPTSPDSTPSSSSSYIVSTTSSSESSAAITDSATYSSTGMPSEIPETVISYIDVTITSCPPEASACPTKMDGGSSSPSDAPSSNPVTDVAPTQSSDGPESYTTVITTNYVGICPTGYTTIPYTTTVVTAPGASSTPWAASEVPVGFTTTVVICPACNSASPTVTLTVPVISVLPVPVSTAQSGEHPSGETPSPSASTPPAGYPSGESSSAGSLPAGYPLAETPVAGYPSGETPSGDSPLAGSSSADYPSGEAPTAGSSPTGDNPSAPTPPQSSAAPATDLSPKPTASGPGYSSAAPTVATPPYNAGNGTASFKTAPTSAGPKTTGVSTGLSGAEATRPAAYTGGASRSTEGTFVAVLIAAIWAELMIM